jgi:hypothetical protein
MANTILTPTAVTRKAAQILHQKLNFIGRINRQYDDSYAVSGAKIGDTLKIRLPNEYTVRTGLTMSVQDVAETSVSLVMGTVKGVDLNFTSTELLLSIDDFTERIIEPAMSTLAANIEADAFNMYKEVYNLYDGDAASFSFNSMANAKQIITDNLAPLSQRTMTLNTTHSTKFQIDTKGLFHDSANVSKQYRDGIVGQTQGFECFENTMVPIHTTGTAAKATGYLSNNGAAQTGATIIVDTGTTTFLIGDVITFAGVFRVHPETKVSTGVLQQFVITANSGASATSLAISPAISITTGRQNVSNGVADNQAVVKVGAGASETLIQSMAYHKNAFAFVTADLPLPNGRDWARREVVDGISISLIRDFTVADRSFPCRMDVLYGYKAIRPQLAARVHNDG